MDPGSSAARIHEVSNPHGYRKRFFLYVESLSKNGKAWLEVFSESDERVSQIGAAFFKTESGNYFFPEDSIKANFDASLLYALHTPFERGTLILKKLDELGQKLKQTGLYLELRYFETTQILETLDEIQKVKDIWFAEMDMFPSNAHVHKKKGNQKNTAIVTQNRRIFVNSRQTLCMSQKRPVIYLEVISGCSFIVLKLPKGPQKTNPQLVKRFNREKDIYLNLAEKVKQGHDLKNILLPDTFLCCETSVPEFYKKFVVLPKKDYDLRYFLDKKGIPNDKYSLFFYQIIRGVYNFHKAFPGIFHGDIRLENLLIDPSTHEIFLIDFGILYYQERPCINSLYGTEHYRPPEAFRSYKFNADWSKWCSWTLGMTLAYLMKPELLSKPQNNGANAAQFFKDFLKDPLPLPLYEPLVKGLTKEIPTERLSIEEAFKIISQIHNPPPSAQTLVAP